MNTPTIEDLEDAIAEATRRAASELFSQHNVNFYYFALITTGEGHCPIVSAWSLEALKEASTDENERAKLKWSYADSPYLCFGESHFDKVKSLFALRQKQATENEKIGVEKETNLRLIAMERALRRLDAEGLFGNGTRRLSMVINAEVMPPDSSNTRRAVRLNPPEALKFWLNEAAE